MKIFSTFSHASRSFKFYRTALISSGLLFAAWQQSVAQGNKTPLTIPDEYLSSGFVGTGNFNAIIFGNFQSNSGDVEGRLAVAGDFTLTTAGYSVGMGVMGVNAPNNTDNLVVNGSFNNIGNWGLRGSLVYNTAPNGTVFPSLTAPAVSSITGGKFDHIKFSDNKLLDYYRTLSGTLNALPNTGTTAWDNYHQYTLTGTSLGLNVFDITLPPNMSSDEIRVDIPEGASAIINVLNSSLSINGGSMKMNGADKENNKVLFNFPNATSISLAHFKFLGSFLAPKASLNGNGGSINGQSIIGGHFDQQGGFEFHNFYFEENTIVLPVTLAKFSATGENASVALRWTTTSETNSDRFEIEHSLNGKSWNRIGTVLSHGESAQSVHYTFTDQSPANGENLYRLKMIDLDETFAYSSIQNVRIEAGSSITLFPNPASDKILIRSNTNVALLTITDLSGRKVYQAQEIPAAGIDCKNLPSGMYVVTMTRVNGAVESDKILIRR
ncbi:Por secretion system C-terminal sorting domain-containing protein/choice-of-anchor A domain-containing protein [Dyadobacter sp. SG02]|uniref:choice-of-anchor A family protein n=1 Tax=Dyadobacter sp. SG02 TaxID=1855291 RepID=UPI0008BFFFE4|nr:choice-of-anchor A family protein [Dyadobacter sp. SG02]SEJ59651.1 Por secretion system C-terminal sorting domain-containing protein/choice-of-anchor A domain-containing protein [Dyadobacter sp. SG02]